MKKISSLLICLLFSLAFIPNVSAINFQGSLERTYLAEPGEIVEDSFTLKNTEKEPRVLAVVLENFTIDPEDRTKKIYGGEPSNGMKDWIEFIDKPEQLADPGEEFNIKYKINVPQNAAPGTYTASFGLMGNKPAIVGAEQSGVAMASRIRGHIYLTVNGDFNENITITDFSLDKESFANGEIIFNIDIKNEGDVSVAGTGTIKIFDSSGKQLTGVNAKTQNFDGEEVVTERSDALIINGYQKVVLPGAPGRYQVPWTNRQASEGNYTAKLELFYGQENKQINKELKFEISQNFAILDLNAENVLNASLPVLFKIKLANTGNINLSPKGYFEVKNIFGSQKTRIDINDLTILGGQEIELNDFKWESGFALGLYSANLHLDVNGQIFEKSSMFWVLNWWQILISLAVVILLVLIVVKGVSGYKKMKRKVRDLEAKEKAKK